VKNNQVSRPASGGRQSRRPAALLFVVLLLSALALYWRIGGHEFLNYDDNVYITENENVRAGLTWHSLAWAFASHAANWHPLTWISHMIDVELFGLRPRGHHLHNAILHAVNGGLLFLVLRQLTGALWSSALVAALFAVHPLHVESVAWAAERKDLLAGCFWMLTLLAYSRYVRAPGRARFAVLITAYALGLLAKPMLVTLPAILVLLDFWPLGRLGSPSFRRGGRWRPLLEKAPLFALAGTSSVVTIIAQRSANAVAYSQEYPLGARVANALASVWAYLGQTLWPAGLTFYPFAGWQIPLWESLAAGALLAAATAALAALARRRPAALVGWLWYLVSLLPVIGLIQVGVQARADRYTYLPLIGIFLVVAWSLRGLVRRVPSLRLAAAALCLGALLALAARAWVQAGHWRSSVALFTHAAAQRPDNWIALNSLGSALLNEGRVAEGQAALSRAYRLNSYLRFDLLVRTGDVLAGQGLLREALANYMKAREMIPYDRLIGGKIADVERRLGR
jgi:tetratricopeptide (TPR) repeat protein